MSETNGDGRGPHGRFTEGNSGGPGRPRRATERVYLAVLSDSVSLDDWRAVVQAAVAAAKTGDDKARAWLAKYLLGDKPPSLLDLLADEESGTDGVAIDIEQKNAERERTLHHAQIMRILSRSAQEHRMQQLGLGDDDEVELPLEELERLACGLQMEIEKKRAEEAQGSASRGPE